MSDPLSTRIRAGFGFGSVATGAFSTVPGLLLLFYMTEVLAIPAAVAGTIVFVPKLWDAVTDPFMGALSDRTTSASGRRLPWMRAGAILLPLAFVAMFAPPLFSPALWVFLAYVLAATAYTLYSIPYISLPAELTDDPDETTVMLGWRTAFMTVGILGGGAVGPAVVKGFGGGPPGYLAMGVFMAVLLLSSMGLCIWALRDAPRRDTAARPDDAGSLGDTMRGFLADVQAIAGNTPFVTLLVSYFGKLLGVGTVLAVVPYLARYVLKGDEGTVTALFVSLIGPAILTMPVWVWASKRIGTKVGYLASLAMFGLGCLLMYVVPPGPGVYALVALMGVGYAGSQLFPFSMLPDVQRAELARTGVAREGVMTGVWMASDKGGIALGAFVAAQVLAATGFAEGGVEQTPEAVHGVLLASSLVPAAFIAAGIAVGLRYRGVEG